MFLFWAGIKMVKGAGWAQDVQAGPRHLRRSLGYSSTLKGVQGGRLAGCGARIVN